LTQNRHMLHYT